MSGIAINGRYLTQGLTGVQRVAREIAGALDALAGEGRVPPLRILAPHGAAAAGLAHVPTVTVGQRAGQAWEQLDLPAAANGAMLLNLGNTAPIRAGRQQAVVIHDAGAFDTPESYSFAFRTWYRLLHRVLAWRGARIITVSEFSRGRIAHHLGIAPDRIGVMPEGAEHILRAPADAAVLARHGLAPGRYALAVGTRAAHKNLDVLADVASLLATRGMVLAAVGAVDPTVFRPAGAGAGGVALGRVSDAELRALYENALCLVFPSRYEGFGLPPLEAMRCGCPVIAAQAGAVPEVCGDAALWFDGSVRDSLPGMMLRLLDEPGLADTMRAAGLARAENFTWRRAAETLLRLIEAPA